ncbi:MAG TPA: alpha-galactosidase, partial [bacterium]|nr:alpha-galactosidase [bacterium]
MGNGSVTFHVSVNGKEVYASPVMRLADGPIPISIPLHGAEEFEIQVGDGGDGRGWDQALWAEAVIELTDGSQIRLQDFPLAGIAKYNPYMLSFLFQNKQSREILGEWERAVTEDQNGPDRLNRQILYRDPKTQLEIRAEITLFRDFPAMEWILYFKNTGKENTPLIENILPLDAVLGTPGPDWNVLHWSKGGVASFDDFAPQTTVLKPNETIHLQPGGGRSSSQVLPFFNLRTANGGTIIAVGWTGEWATEFISDPAGNVTVKSGMANTHLVLYPGEEIRTPRMLLLTYEGDRWRGQNLFRQFILTHHRPKRNGEPLIAPITNGNWGGTPADIHLDNIEKIIRHNLPVEYYWIDAEWYGKPGGPESWPVNVGSWTFKEHLYPQGFQPLSKRLRETNRNLMLWFEPERVFKNTIWYEKHHDWLIDIGEENALLNLGIPEARQFLTDFISDKVEEFGLGCYRQDFNIDPLRFWQAADKPDRQGITEIRYIEGLYAFWDDLLKRHADLIIDNCASGGRRLDLETLGRATPFWRTDGPRDPIAHQCHTWGLLPWVPFSATSQDRAGDDYEFRSSMCSSLCLNWWVSGDVRAGEIRADFPYDWAKKTLDRYLQYRQYYYGDYYPLLDYSQSADLWYAYQMDRPDLGEGLVVVLRRPASSYTSANLKLRGLAPEQKFRVTNPDTGETTVQTGEFLFSEGLPVLLRRCPGSAIFLYQRL